MKKYCLALDLKDDEKLIQDYEQYHQPENMRQDIVKSIRDAHVLNMEIFRTGNRLFMIMEVDNEYSHNIKKRMDESNPAVVEWEALMDTFQQALPWAKPGQKWVLMNQIFSLNNNEL
jgi:L-rhamnose mutarotase